MVQTQSDIVLHVVFSTKDRQPLVLPETEKELYRSMCGVARQHNSPVIKINGMEDHVHLLLHLGRTISVSDLLSELKSSSSRWIKTRGAHYEGFSWQRGFGAFSVSRSVVEGAIQYISNQKEHHQTVSFKEEFLSMLKRAGLDYDEKFLWD